jgi:hypothetical protein
MGGGERVQTDVVGTRCQKAVFGLDTGTKIGWTGAGERQASLVVCVRACECMCLCMCLYVCMYVCVYAYIQICVCVYVCVGCV